MSTQSNFNNLSYGLQNPLQSLAPQPIISKRAPVSTDSAAFGALWINQAVTPQTVYVFTASQTWQQLAADAAAGVFSSLTVTGNSVLNGLVATATGNTAGDITLRTNGGTSETLLITNSQGTSASAINITATAGGIALNPHLGALNIAANAATAAAFSVTNNALVGRCTLTGQTLASAASQAITLTNSNITASNAVLVSISNLNVSTNGASLTIQGIIQAAGSVVINVKNNSGATLATSDTIIIAFMVLN